MTDDTDLPYIDDVSMIEWIHEQHPDIDQAAIAAVIRIHFEYLVGVGITQPIGQDALDAHEPRYYQPGDLDDAPRGVVHEAVLAHDAERLAGVPFLTAIDVLHAERAFLDSLYDDPYG